MADVAPNTKTEALKRRSTRIVQAVPLTVTGVDALGRPFEERTSTSIINCNGCRYQSKHYVLKNMWVTLEVPHPEQGRAPRSVRARVMWIQRPRTVRELFQVGVELEVTGNLWGIAFCPPDWFPFPDSESGISAPPAKPFEGAFPEITPAASPAANEVWSGAQEQVPAEDNLRTMPMAAVEPGVEPSMTLTRQMAGLVNDAKQQLRAAVRDEAAEAVSAQAQPLLASMQTQLQEVAAKSGEAAAATAAEQAIRNAVEKAEAMAEARLRTLVDHWNAEFARILKQHHQELEAQKLELQKLEAQKLEPQNLEPKTLEDRPAEIAQEKIGALEQQLHTQVERGLTELETAAVNSHATLERAQKNFEALHRQAEDSLAAALREGAARLQMQADDAHTRVSEIETVLRHSVERIAPISASAEADWKARLEADTTTASKRWDDRVESSLESAAQRVAERLSGATEAAREQFERELGERIAAIGKTFMEATADAENRLGAARTSFESQAGQVQALLTQVQSGAQTVAEQTSQLGALQQTAQQELERRSAALIDLQSQELARRGDAAMAAWTERLQPSLEAAGQETITRLGAQLEQHVGSHIDRANQVLGRLESESLAAGEAQRKHEETLATLSDRTVESSIVQMQKQIDGLEHDFQEAGRNAVSQWLAEMDAKATETTHTTFESLFKTAEWYEKKVQTHMQAALDKGVEHGVEQMREKAGEISRLFAGELDHYSRSYVEHTREQIEEAGRQTLERTHKESAEMTAASFTALAQQMQSGSDAAMRDFHANAGAALSKLAAQIEAKVAESRANAEAAAQHLSGDFGANIAQQVEQALASSKQALASQMDSARDTLHAESAASEKQLRDALASASDQGIDTYKQRLENTANSWLLTTVSRLHQDSQQHLGTLSRTAEARLRETCKQVFASVGEALSQQVLDPAAPPPAQDCSDERS